ncbi:MULTISPECIES: hypothetical protein [Methylomonas]|nr:MULTISPECIES: hypothetical protein [Methylomonas]ATG88756.1 hypothetical protein MKLM6_0480 [Methylomonas koyamae]WNB76415.1 hypothetical protein RI210_02245 [Methylomonas koyamae]
MKMVIVILSGLVIGALVVIAALQLIRVVGKEFVDLMSEAWNSAETH